jgi:hypothetical protein
MQAHVRPAQRPSLLSVPETHPLEHHAAFRALIAAAPPIAELSTRIAHRGIISALAIACSDLADGFASPPESRPRLAAHRRAWIHVREIDRVVAEAVRNRRVPRDLLSRAQRAVDRADVLVGALIP